VYGGMHVYVALINEAEILYTGEVLEIVLTVLSYGHTLPPELL